MVSCRYFLKAIHHYKVEALSPLPVLHFFAHNWVKISSSQTICITHFDHHSVLNVQETLTKYF